MPKKFHCCKKTFTATENPAKRLAVELRDKLILVYGSGLFGSVARRWKSQFNENAKAWSFYETIPEMLHNSVEAFRSSSLMTDWGMALLLQPNNAWTAVTSGTTPSLPNSCDATTSPTVCCRENQARP